MILKEINTLDAAYQQLEELFIEAFPENERRDLDLQRVNVDSNSSMHCLAIIDEAQTVGLLTYWDFGSFAYVEHFAILQECRNGGLGARAMKAFQELVGMPIVLEVEMPVDELSLRRVGFYQRQGFRLWENQEYLQPPYRQGDGYLPMRLMATAGLDAEKDFAYVRATIHKDVYGVDTP